MGIYVVKDTYFFWEAVLTVSLLILQDARKMSGLNGADPQIPRREYSNSEKIATTCFGERCNRPVL